MVPAGSKGVRAVAVLAWVALVAQLALLGWQLSAGRPAAEVLLWAAAGPVPTVLLAVLATVLGRHPAGSPPAIEPAAGAEQEESTDAGEPVALERRPSWAPDEASGAVWTTAGDAARGAEAQRWGTPGSGRGWGTRVDPEDGSEQPQDDPRQ